MKRYLVLGSMILLLALLTQGFSPANAATTCTFSVSGSTMLLNGNCTTDETIYIPNGFTLDGRGFTITAVDPSGGHFLGAVVENAGTVAHVRRLKITASGLSDVCDSGSDALAGIRFGGAAGTIRNNTITSLKQGTASACNEGVGIEVFNPPFDGSHPATLIVIIKDNTITDYQRSGIVVEGDVLARVVHNTAYGQGPVTHIVQHGIQFLSGALGKAEDNTVWGNMYTPLTFAGAGILLFGAGNGVKVEDNHLDANDLGVWVILSSSARILENVATGSTFDGIALDDQAGPVTNTIVNENWVGANGVGVGIYGADNNLIKYNRAEGNGTGFYVGFVGTLNTLQQNHAQASVDFGIRIDSDSNVIRRNRAFGSGVFDIANTGSGNTYSSNSCATSTGPPVDCPTTTLSAAGSASARSSGGAAIRPAPSPYR